MKKKLEVIGEICPFPLIEAKREMEQMNDGDELIINFDCTQATESIPRWAAESGHKITNFEQTDDATWTITIKKGAL
ncbi:TusA-related sulfurtransferase [Cerasibacillus quisquiliarum]|uniref:Oxidoreductase n=1 Tax=Cerasibacillus quisquiliarum TaxID=227865 RepID=A0A511UY45_9BACI|nr:sulfurtransferase TusA family protein [Cerasibacillus quisquiliarum]MBB5146747.1 TusA-related sulfurtransferase [Cerasibacillus quisquiliarum]GEN31547.1 oxidoreductase [Cerasibacillus quisquiliarum]